MMWAASFVVHTPSLETVMRNPVVWYCSQQKWLMLHILSALYPSKPRRYLQESTYKFQWLWLMSTGLPLRNCKSCFSFSLLLMQIVSFRQWLGLVESMSWPKVSSLVFRFWNLPWTMGSIPSLNGSLDIALSNVHTRSPRWRTFQTIDATELTSRKSTESCWCLNGFHSLCADV